MNTDKWMNEWINDYVSGEVQRPEYTSTWNSNYLMQLQWQETEFSHTLFDNVNVRMAKAAFSEKFQTFLTQNQMTINK